MIPVTSFFSTSLANKFRIPIYRVKFSGITKEFVNSPIKTNYFDEMMMIGPSAYWRFGEAVTSPVTTVATDSSGNAQHGVYHNTPALQQAGSLVGDSDTAVSLTGTEYISVVDNALLDPGDNFTLLGRVKLQNISDYQSIYDKGNNGYYLYVEPGGHLRLAKQGVGDIVQSTIVVTYGAWMSFMVTKNGSSVHMYINWTDVTGAVTNRTIVGTASDLYIGYDHSLGAHAVGYFDEFAIYPYAISPTVYLGLVDAAHLTRLRTPVGIPAVRMSESLQLGAAQVIPERGQSSVSPFTFILNDNSDWESEVLADNPNLLIRCNDMKGTVARDYSGNGLNGAYSGLPQFGNSSPISYGSPDWAVRFDGTQFIQVADNDKLDFASDIFTLEVWVYPDAIGFAKTWYLFSKGVNGYYLSIGFGNVINFGKHGVGDIANGGINPQAWNHIVVVKNGASCKIYNNTVDVTSFVGFQAIAATSTDLFIGRIYSGSAASSFSGVMFGAAVFPSALSIDRIKAHYLSVSTRLANTQNGIITRLVAEGLEQRDVEFSFGFDDITEQNYVKLPVGQVDSVQLTKDLTGYQFNVSDPTQFINKRIFNVTASPLAVAINNTDTSAWVKDASGYEAPGYLRIEGEELQYSGKTFTGVPINGNPWKAIAYGNGTYVAVATDGSISSSTDGKNWLKQVASETNTWNGIVWAAGLNLFVVVGSTGTHRVMTSPDGEVWSMQTAAAALQWQAVAWAPSLALLCAVAGPTGPTTTQIIMVSTDGISWSSGNGYIGSNAIAWSPDLGMFSTGGMHSDDGVTWVSIWPLPTTLTFVSIAYSSSLGIYAAITSDGTGSIYSSPNGKDWTPRVCTNGGYRSVCWSSDLGLFCAVGWSSSTGQVLTSSDGITWIPRNPYAHNQWKSVVWAGGAVAKFVAVCSDRPTTARVMYSSDGITWSDGLDGIAGDDTDASFWSIAWSSSLGRLCAVAIGVGGGTADQVMTSTNATTWTKHSPAEANSWFSVCWSPTLNLFVAVSVNGTHQVMTSPDGIIWTAQSASEANQWSNVMWDPLNSLLIATSIDGTHRLMTSSDGTTWNNQSISVYLGQIASDGASLLVSCAGYISTNGTTWSVIQNMESNTWTGIAWHSASGLFAAVSSALGPNGTQYAASSTNGTVFTPRSIGGPVQAVCFAVGVTNVIFLAVGSSSVYTTSDGFTWTSRTPAAANVWAAVVWSGTLFVAVANTGSDRAMSSSDGINWFVYQSILTGLTRGLLGTTAASHSIGATVQEMIYLSGHMMDIAKGVLENTTKGGAGIPSASVDEAGIAVIKAALGVNCQGYFKIVAADNCKSWLESNIYQVLGQYPVTSSGKYSIHSMQATLTTSLNSIVVNDIAISNGVPMAFGWSRNFRNSIINSVTFLYDYDGSNYNSAIGGSTDVDFSDAASIAAFDEFPLVIKAAGFHSSQGGIIDVMKEIAQRFLRYKNGVPLMPMRVGLHKFLLEPGDTIDITNLWIPNRTAKVRGVTAKLMEIKSRAINFDQGTVDLNLLWIGW